MEKELDPLVVTASDYGEQPFIEEEVPTDVLIPRPERLSLYQRFLLRKEQLADRFRARRSSRMPEEGTIMPRGIGGSDEVLQRMQAKVEALERLERESALEEYLEERREVEDAEERRRLEIIRRMKEEKTARELAEEEARERAAREREEEIRRLQEEQLRLKKERIKQEKIREYYRLHGGVPKIEQLRAEEKTEKPVRIFVKPLETVKKEEKQQKDRTIGSIRIRKIKL